MTSTYKTAAAALMLAAFSLTGCHLQMMHRSTCCHRAACNTAHHPTACQTGCEQGHCQDACGCVEYEVDPWCGFTPCRWRQHALERSCPQGTVRYIRRDSKPAVFGGHGAPGGLAPQSVAYYIPPPHLKPQKPAPAQHFKPASRHRFEPAPAPAIQQPPHRAQPIEGSQPTMHPPVVSEGENREEPSAANIPANEIPPVDVQPAAENTDDAASSIHAPEPVIRPLDDPADPTAPRNLIPGLTN